MSVVAADATAPKRPLVIAHRGASASAPENTLAAYSTAVEMQVDVVEMDLHMTRSGELVSIHDETMDRTTNGTGPVRSLDLCQIKQLDAGSWFYNPRLHSVWDRQLLCVPTLAEVIELVRDRSMLCIELKHPEIYPGLEERMVDTLRNAGLLDDPEASGAVMVQAFSDVVLRKLAVLAPELTLSQLTNPGEAVPVERLDEFAEYAQGWGPDWRDVTQEIVDEAHARGLFVHPYTVNARETMRSLIRMGVDGIITDNCVELKRVVREELKRRASNPAA